MAAVVKIKNRDILAGLTNHREIWHGAKLAPVGQIIMEMLRYFDIQDGAVCSLGFSRFFCELSNMVDTLKIETSLHFGKGA